MISRLWLVDCFDDEALLGGHDNCHAHFGQSCTGVNSLPAAGRPNRPGLNAIRHRVDFLNQALDQVVELAARAGEYKDGFLNSPCRSLHYFGDLSQAAWFADVIGNEKVHNRIRPVVGL